MNKFERTTYIAIALAALASAGIIFLAVIASALFSYPAAAQQPNTAAKANRCVSTIQHHANVQKKIAGREIPIRFRILRNGAARRFMAVYNSLPPETNLQFDTVGIIVIAGSPAVFLTFAKQACVAEEQQVPVKMFLKMLDESGNRLGDA